MTKHVWEEQWNQDGGNIDLMDGHAFDETRSDERIGHIGHFSSSRLLPEVERAKLAAAAPAMALALCSVEWTEDEDGNEKLRCSWCMQTEPNHQDYCGLDKALTQAGLDDDARETVRENQYMQDKDRLAQRGIILPHPRPRLRLVPACGGTSPTKKDPDDGCGANQ